MNSYRKYGKEWRRRNPEKWNESKKRYYQQTQDADNHKERWTEEEIDLIIKHEVRDMELSKILKRSVKAIQVMRSKVKGGYRYVGKSDHR